MKQFKFKQKIGKFLHFSDGCELLEIIFPKKIVFSKKQFNLHIASKLEVARKYAQTIVKKDAITKRFLELENSRVA